MDVPADIFLFLLFLQEESAHTAAAIAPSLTEVLIKIFFVFVIVALNGFFVAAEFSLVSVRKTRIEARAEEGSGNAKAALRLLNNPTLFISAVQLGVTLASLALGWLGEPTIAHFLEPIADRLFTGETALYIAHTFAIIIAFSIITFLHVTFGELIPKMFALEKAETFALVAARPLELFAKIFSPILWILNLVGGAVGKLLGLKSTLEHASVYTEEEIRQLVNLSQESGHLNKEERRLIHQIFEFSDTTVKEAMIPRREIVGIQATSTLADIAHAFEQHGYSRMPVYRGSLDDIAGVIHGKDVMGYLLRQQDFRLEKVLQKPIYIVDTARLEDVLRQMQKAKTHFGFVVDEHGGVEGIITLEDLLEEIVGDISDEHDEEVNEQIREVKPDVYMLDGALAVRDLNRRLDLNLPVSEGYTTIAGFLMNESGQILSEGESVPFNGHVFKIEKVDKRRILKVRMEKS
ncbi:MAG: HlyC/CorC family transporter [Acidobacteria bacterium]|nr:HlyC/CorC family transporter [Acidobacteriota bacterium]